MFSTMDFSRELEGRDEDTSPFFQFNQTLLPVSQNAGNVVEEEELFPDLLDISSDMETFLAMNNIEEVKEEVTESTSDILPNILHEVGIHEQPATTVMSGEETTQSLIDEVERYLQTVSGESTKVDEEEDVMEMSVDVSASIERSWTLGGSPGPAPSSPAESTKPVIDAEKIFQALTTGNVFEQDQIDLDRAYTTSVVDKAGENVIIIIAPPTTSITSAASAKSAASPIVPDSSVNLSALSPMAASTSTCGSPASMDSFSDYEWTPTPPSTTVAVTSRRKYQRKNKPTPPTGPYPKEKGERKKAQNRTAAFRYREKKKAEQDAADMELTQLFDKNAELKRRLAEMEVEAKCLKKLMIDTGLGQYLNNTAAVF